MFLFFLRISKEEALNLRKELHEQLVSKLKETDCDGEQSNSRWYLGMNVEEASCSLAPNLFPFSHTSNAKMAG